MDESVAGELILPPSVAIKSRSAFSTRMLRYLDGQALMSRHRSACELVAEICGLRAPFISTLGPDRPCDPSIMEVLSTFSFWPIRGSANIRIRSVEEVKAD